MIKTKSTKTLVTGCQLLVMFFCFGILGCGNSNKEDVTFKIATFSPEELQYPTREVLIPDTYKMEFRKNFFLPWEESPSKLMSSLKSFPGKELSYLQKYLDDDAWYGENKKPHTREQREEIVNNISTENFPNFLKQGIVIAHTDLRRIPTNRPGFDTYSKAGEGYPFDYFQETNLWANTPVLLVHISKDKLWCYVISPYYKGWVSTHDVAIANEDFREPWSRKNFCLPLSDDISLQNPLSHYAVNAKVGMVLPYEEIPGNPEKVMVYYASADENQNAQILKSEVKKDQVAFNSFSFDRDHLEPLVSQLLGRPYGWGGTLENRDCSSLIRDLLGTYRVWLPRDSKDQIDVGHKYELPEATDAKIKQIQKAGTPFLTLLRKKGHNMLYVGNTPQGEPLILHAIWGLKTSYSDEQLAHLLEAYPIEGIHEKEDGKLSGRHIIGESVITSVSIGEGNGKVTLPLIEEIYAMTNILEK